MEKRLIAILSVSLVAALMMIAFQAGKLSVKPSEGTPQTSPVVRAEKPAEAQITIESERLSEAAPLISPPIDPRAASADLAQLLQPLQTSPDAPHHSEPLPLPRGEQANPPHRPSDTGSAAAVASYFSKIDAIHVEGSGDPTAFAQGILGGIQSGDSSQMDKLVNDAKLALGQADSVKPPSVCADYHRRLIETLSESVSGLEKFRNAIQTSDLAGITSVAAQLQSTQKKINDLELMRKQLLGQ
jgi:hypothetical protein